MCTLRDDYLIDVILQGFDSVEKPSRHDLVSHQCLECNELRDAFCDIEGKDIPIKVLKRYCGSLPFFTPNALRYYLPVFMIYCLRNKDLDCLEYLMYELSPKELDAYHKSRVDVFSKEEKQLIIRFIEHIKRSDDECYFDEEYRIALDVWKNE